MDITVAPGKRRGAITAPPSKSDAHRALICSALARGETKIRLGGGMNEDIEATVRCLRALGAEISGDSDVLTVTPPEGRRAFSGLDCGESGSTLRFLLPCASLFSERASFFGRGKLPERPIGELLSVMAENGCAADGERLPLTLSGSLSAGEYILPGNVSSQFITGLLLALCATAGESKIRLCGTLESPEYVKMTIAALRKFGAVITETPDGYDISGGELISPGTYDVEGDWSGAAFFIGMTALGGEVAVEGLDPDSSQPDRAIARLSSGLPDIIDVSGFPDIFPALSVIACGKNGVTRLEGAARLRIKESDRIEACFRLITGLGGKCAQEPDALTIYGCGRLRGGAAESFNDHRIAMSAAVAAAICGESVTVIGAQAVKKSYAAFWNELDKLKIFH